MRRILAPRHFPTSRVPSRPRAPSDFLAAWFSRPMLPPAEQAEFDGYYLRFRRAFGPRLWHWYDRQLAELGAGLAERPGARVLEIGMGTATESLWVAMQGAEVTDVKPYMPQCASPVPVRRCSRRLSDAPCRSPS